MKEPISIEVQIKRLTDEIKSLRHDFNDLRRQVETLDQDRAIVESLQGAIRSLEEQERLTREHLDTAVKNIVTEIMVHGKRTEEKVGDQVGELTEAISTKKNVKIEIKSGFLDKLKKRLGGEI